MKRHINLPGFGPLHIAFFIPLAVFVLSVVGIFGIAVIKVLLHTSTPEEIALREAKKAAEAAEADKLDAQEEAAKRKRDGYLDDPEVIKETEAVIKSHGYSCPGVHGVRALGDQGRGNVLRVQCRNNVFFALTVLPDNRGFLVEILD